jgi:hypothetical protein
VLVERGCATAKLTRTVLSGVCGWLVRPIAKRVKSHASEHALMLPPWCVELLRVRQVRMGGFEGPVFPDAKGGWRDRSNVGKVFRAVREASDVDWWRRTGSGRRQRRCWMKAGERTEIADQLGHSRVSMTQDVYVGLEQGKPAIWPHWKRRVLMRPQWATRTICPRMRPGPGRVLVGPVGLEPTTRGESGWSSLRQVSADSCVGRWVGAHHVRQLLADR